MKKLQSLPRTCYISFPKGLPTRSAAPPAGRNFRDANSPVVKRLRPSSIAFYLLLFLVIQIPLAAFLAREAGQKEERYLEGKKETFQAEFRAVAASFTRLAVLTHDELTASGEVGAILREAGRADEPARENSRQRLLARVGPAYRSLIKQDFMFMHFHLADGTIFLRLHDPATFGDLLSDFAAGGREGHTQKRYVEGFEGGRHGYAFRYIFPLFAGEEYVGGLEIGAPFSAWKKALLEIFNADYSLHLKGEPGGAMAAAGGGAYVPSDLLPGFVREKTGPDGEGRRSPAIEPATVALIDRQISGAMVRELPRGEAALVAAVKGAGYVVMALPIRDIEGRVAGYLVSHARDTTPATFGRIALVTYVAMNIMLLLLFLLHRYFAAQMLDRLRFQQNLIDAIPTPVCYKNINGEFLGCNTAFGELIGRPPAEIPGRTARDIYPAEMAATVQRHDQAVLAKGGVERYESAMAGNDGTLRHLVTFKTPFSDQTGRVAGIIGSFLDVTASKQAAEALKQSHRELEQIFNTAADGMRVVDRNFVMLLANDPFAALTGLTKKEILGKKCYEVFAGSACRTSDCPLSRILAGATRVEAEAMKQRPDGGRIPCIVTATPYRDIDGRLIGIIEDFKDITERQKVETELNKARQLESIGTLAGGIAHDFNNMLTAILGNLSLARLEDLPEPATECLEEAEKAAMRARDLTMELITFAQGGAPVKTAVSLAHLLRHGAGFALRGSNVGCAFVLADDLWQVEADADQFAKVIHNLVVNADEAMPAGGTITVRADNLTISGPDSSPHPPGRYVRVAVADQGSGIRPDHREKIFDPYFSTKERGSRKGMGLGLAVCHSIVSRHRGHLRVESTSAGTTFEVLLPAVAETAAAISAMSGGAAGPPVAAGPMQGRILLMDDDRTIQKVSGHMLRHLGYEVDLADDGRQAVDLYVAAGRAGAAYHAVIMDLTVPGGMGGVETLGELRALDAEIKAIVSSGYATDPVMADYARHGFKAAMVKPYDLAILRQTLEQVV